MAAPTREELLRHLQAKGYLTADEVRTALGLLEEAAQEGREVSLPEILIRAGAMAAQAHHAAAALEAGQDVAAAEDLAVPEIRSSGLALLEKIGRGSQAIVYKCRQAIVDRIVAVKILLPSAAGDAESRARFIQEGKTAAQLSHPNIVTIHEIRPLKNTICIVMEYVDGGTVSELLKVRQRFDPAEAVLIIRQVAEGLRAAHARKLIHRDIKPSNIMITSDGLVKLADMGLVRHVGQADEPAGKAYGTPYYISPEQVTGDPPPDHRTDLYSLGVTLYEMVTGRPPFMAATPQEIMRMHVLATPPDPRDFVPDLPQSLCWFLAKAMAREPEDRYQTAQDFINALDRLEFPALETSAAAPDDLASQMAPAASEERRRASRLDALTRATLGGSDAAPAHPGHPARVAALAGRDVRGASAPHEAGRPDKGKGLVVGIVVFLAVAVVGAAVVLGVFGSGLFSEKPDKRSTRMATMPKPSVPPSGGELSDAEQSAQIALKGAKNLEVMPGVWREDIIKSYRNVIAFYPDTQAAAEAEQALDRLRRAAPAPVEPPPRPPPKPPTPPSTKPPPAKPPPTEPKPPPDLPPLPEPPKPEPPKPEPPPPQAEPPKEPAKEPAGDLPTGAVEVHARDAAIHGGGARYEKAQDRDNIGFWNDPATWVEWKVPKIAAGSYTVEVVYSLDAGAGGGEIQVSVGGELLAHKAEGTGGWGTFVSKPIGTVRVARAGPVAIGVRPLKVKGGGVVNLQAVRLVPKP